MRWRRMKDFAKSFELSSCAAARVGPKMRKPCSRKVSTMPLASAASGPTTVRLIPSALAQSASASLPSNATLTRCWSRAVPPLPGATQTFCTRGDCASLHASACSRPPEPTTRTFISLFERGSGVDLLHVVEVVERVEQPLHLLRVLAGEHRLRERLHRHFGELGFQARLPQRFPHMLEVAGRAFHFNGAVLVGDD